MLNRLDTAMVYVEGEALDNIYLASDFHFKHRNILEYDKRPFKDLQEMEEYIIKSINDLPIGSVLFFLWDLHLWNNDAVADTLSRIHCPMYWILGNHDSKASINKLWHYFRTVSKDCWINERIYLSHFPPKELLREGTYHIHGHTHQPWRKNNVIDISYNGKKLIYKLTDLVWH